MEAYTCSPSAKPTEVGGENILRTHCPTGHLFKERIRHHSGEDYIHIEDKCLQKTTELVHKATQTDYDIIQTMVLPWYL